MKNTILVTIMLLAVALLNASLGWTYVKSESYGSAVVRVVIGLYGEGDPSVSKTSESLSVKLNNYEPGNQPKIYHNPGALVESIVQSGAEVRISIARGFRFEQSSFNSPRRLVLDVFVSNPDKAQRLQIADFYSEKGKWNSADKIYNDLHIDYREDMQILYNWALLLHKRGSVRATDKLSQIPPESSYYQQAQNLLAKIHGDEEPLPPPPPLQTPVQPESTEDSTAVKDTIITAPLPAPISVPATKIRVKLGFAPVLVLLSVLLAIAIIVFSFRKTKPSAPRPVHHPNFNSSDAPLDTKTMCRMVSKLLADGWTQREISRELKISQRDVEGYVQLCHQGGHEDNEA
jgi:hypothetical protein